MFTVALYWCDAQYDSKSDDSHVIAKAETALQMFDTEQDAIDAAKKLAQSERLTLSGQRKACVVRGYPISGFGGMWNDLTTGQNPEVIIIN